MGGRVKTIMARLLERDRLAPVEIPPGGWEVNLRRDPDGELARGQLGIVSTLAMPAPVEYGGTPTTRIVRSIVGASGRAATVTPRAAAGRVRAVPAGRRRPSGGGVRARRRAARAATAPGSRTRTTRARTRS